MFSTSLLEFEMRQEELHRQAAEDRVVRSLREPNLWAKRVFTAVGKLMVTSGQQLVNRYQPAQSAHC